jgi:hypothetical protein
LRSGRLAAFENVLFEFQQLLHNMKLRGIVGRCRDHLGELLVQVVCNCDHLRSLWVLCDDVLQSSQGGARSGVRRGR